MATADNQFGRGPQNANEAYFDAIVRHQIGLLRVSGNIRNQILKILDATEKDLIQEVRRNLQRGRSVTRQEILIKSIRAIRSDAWKQSAQVWRDEIIAVAQAEPEFMARSFQTVSPAVVDLALPSPALLRSIVTTRPFEGQVLNDWARSIRRADLDRMERSIRIGITQGEPIPVISRRIVGTAAQRGTNGVTEITRRQAEAITRTAVVAVTNQAKREFYELNQDVIQEEIYVATLDGRTTPVCRSLDGKTYPIGEGPIPPVHFNCRSVRVATIDGEAIGNRPARAFTQRQLLREYNRANGTNAATRADLPRGHKGSFDAFARRRMRELTGTVDAKVTYQSWLERQPVMFQNDVLGDTRGKLFRKGGLTLDRFVDQRGNEIPLSELARRDAAAFRAAGLDPDDFT